MIIIIVKFWPDIKQIHHKFGIRIYIYASNVNVYAKNSKTNMHGPEKSLELIYILISGKGIKDINFVHKP